MVRATTPVFLVALVAAASATAKDGVAFDRAQARVGDRLVLASSWAAHPNGLVAYLVPLAVSPKWWHISSVRPGRYVLGIWCTPCNEHWTSALPNWQPNPRGILRIVP